jgi:hypothetical protein
VAEDKLFSYENPMFAKNFKLLLQKMMMQDGGIIWEVIVYLHATLLAKRFLDLVIE